MGNSGCKGIVVGASAGEVRRLRVPTSLSVALVSGVLAAASCSSTNTPARDGAPTDSKPPVADAGTPIDAARDKPADVMLAMDMDRPSQPDGASDARDGASDTRDGSSDLRDGPSPMDLRPDLIL
ncbi:MAG TPA: hypothetical protein VGG33_22050 [Polyangia bacterium]